MTDTRREYHRLYYAANKERLRKQANERNKVRKKQFEEYKKTLFCERCGENDPACLEFHHKDPKTKEYSIARLSRRCFSERFMNEIRKCVVLCANCHKKLHYYEGDNA